MHVAAGDLTVPVVFRRYGETGRDEWNEEEGGWTTLEKAWAKRRDISDGEKIANGDQVSRRLTRLAVRSTPVLAGLTAMDRVEIDAQDWNILGVKVWGETLDGMLEVTAEWRSDDGGD